MKRLGRAFAAAAVLLGASVVAIGGAVVDAAPAGAGSTVTGRGANAKIVFQRQVGSEFRIWVGTTDGSLAATNVSGVEADPGDIDSDPELSFDGTKIAFARNQGSGRHIWVMRADGTGQTQITTGSGVDDDPTWSPDGAHIAYAHHDGAQYDINVVPSSGGASVDVTNDVLHNETDPVWSPTDPIIAFRGEEDDTFGPELFYVNVSNLASPGTRVNLTSNNAQNDQPTFSPDGTRLAWTFNGVYLKVGTLDDMVNATDAFFVATAGNILNSPTWSPDGTKIAYTELAPSGGSHVSVIASDRVEQAGAAAPVAVTDPGTGQDTQANWGLKTGSVNILELQSPSPGVAIGFTIAGPGPSATPVPFSLTGGQSQGISLLAAGSYTIVQSAVAGRPLTALACTPVGTGNVGTRTATVTLTTQGEDVTCKFTNRLVRPDALLRKAVPANDVYVGSNVYNPLATNAQPQSKNTNVKRGQVATFFARIQEDTATAEIVKLKGTPSTKGFLVAYAVQAGNTFVPINQAAITQGTYSANVPPGAVGKVIRIKVTVLKSAAVLSAKHVLLTATSSLDPTVKDTVRARTTVVQ